MTFCLTCDGGPAFTSVISSAFPVGLGQGLNAQNRLYTARGYCEESKLQNYQLIKQKIERAIQ